MMLSPTLAINEEIRRRRAKGLPVVALGFGEANIPVHPDLVAELAAHAANGGYGEVAGVDTIRTAAAGYWSRQGLPTAGEQVIAGPGSKPLLFALFEALKGTIVLPQPSWVSYAAQNQILGQDVVQVPIAGEGGAPEPSRMRAECERLRAEGRPATAVLVTIPDNPTGTTATPERIAEVCRVAEEFDLLIISDEIYRDLVHDDATPVVTPSALVPERTIVTTGLSKNLALGGWRLGVARFPDNERGAAVQQRVASVASEIWSAAAHPIQLAGALAFDQPDSLRERIESSRRLHGAITRAVAGALQEAGAEVLAPTGGFYVYPDFESQREKLAAQGISTASDLSRHLLDRFGIATLPGSAFGDDDEHLTLRIAVSMLYGVSDEERLSALASDDPASLPWIAANLEDFATALHDLLA